MGPCRPTLTVVICTFCLFWIKQADYVYAVSHLILGLPSPLLLFLCYSSHLFLLSVLSSPRATPHRYDCCCASLWATYSTSSVFYIILYLILLLLLLRLLRFRLLPLFAAALRDSKFSQWRWQIGASVNGTQCERASHVDYIKRSALICMSRTHIEYIREGKGERYPLDCDPAQRLQFHASSGAAPLRTCGQGGLPQDALNGCNEMMHSANAIITVRVPYQPVVPWETPCTHFGNNI